MPTTSPIVAVAGAAGGLGKLVVRALLARGAAVKALVRPATDAARTEELRQAGAEIIGIDLSDVAALTRELQGAQCVVSTLLGLQDVIHGVQGHLLDASVQAGVRRFIPSDFALDFTKTEPGSNRNLDLRREFHPRLEASGIAWTTILNGGFMDLMAGDNPMINRKSRKVMYIGNPTQPIDFTSMKDLANFTAAVATDPTETPKFLRCASVTTCVQEMADTQTAVTGQTYTPGWMGTIFSTKMLIRVLRMFDNGKDVFPAWQGMQYMVNMMSGEGKLDSVDNDRYPDLEWTSMEAFLREHNPKP